MVAVPSKYQGKVKWAAQQLGIPAAVVAAQINEESGFNTQALSPTGAQGIAQFEPGTWSGLGCAGSPNNPDDAFKCYVTYMHQLLAGQHGNVRNALAAYNAGPGNIPAGLGYADTILSNAGSNPGLQAGGGNYTGKGAPGPATATLDAATASQCLIAAPSLNLYVTSLGGGCLLSKTTARAIMGGALIVAGAVVMIPGVALLAAFAFRQSGAAAKVVQVAGMIPGEGMAVRAAASAGASAASSSKAQGRHAKTGPNAPAQGRHAAPAGPAPAP